MVKNSSVAVCPDTVERFPSWNSCTATTAPQRWSQRPSTLSFRKCWTPHSESAADKPFETKAFPQPLSTPSLCGARSKNNEWQNAGNGYAL